MGRGFPAGTSGKDPACQCRRLKRCSFDPWVWEIPLKEEVAIHSVFLPAESHGQRTWQATVHGVAKELDMTEMT